MRHLLILMILVATALGGDEEIVALTILGEARGEGIQGMYAVACVLQERSEKRKLTPAKVCLQEWQFSVWNGKKEKDLQGLWKSKSAPYAKQLAYALCNGWKLAQDYTGGANHYYSSDKKTPPYWVYKNVEKIINGKKVRVKIRLKPTKIIGKHLFYKL